MKLLVGVDEDVRATNQKGMEKASGTQSGWSGPLF